MGHSYRDLIVWQKAIGMVTEVYRSTRTFPREETYGLTSQLRRSAVSVASNIAEGQGRLSRKEFRQFLGQARGSLIEMETQVVIAGNLGYLSLESSKLLMDRSGEVSRLLHRLIESLQTSIQATGN
jgi:four helix bundle protein